MDEAKYFNIKFGFCCNFNIYFQYCSNYPLRHPNCPSKLRFIKIVLENRIMALCFKFWINIP